MEVNSQRLLRLFKIALNGDADEIVKVNNLEPHPAEANKKYETPAMFQGLEEDVPRRIYKAHLDKPFITTDDGFRVLKVATLKPKEYDRESVQSMLDFARTYYDDNTDIRITESCEEETAIICLEKQC